VNPSVQFGNGVGVGGVGGPMSSSVTVATNIARPTSSYGQRGSNNTGNGNVGSNSIHNASSGIAPASAGPPPNNASNNYYNNNATSNNTNSRRVSLTQNPQQQYSNTGNNVISQAPSTVVGNNNNLHKRPPLGSVVHNSAISDSSKRTKHNPYSNSGRKSI
jgi:hypothetical protein